MTLPLFIFKNVESQTTFRKVIILFISVLSLHCFCLRSADKESDTLFITPEERNYIIPEDILFADYKLFMIYTRDSIMRELLSNEFVEFYNYLEVYNTPFALNWDIPINLNYEEILVVLTDYGDHEGFYNFLINENNEFYVDTAYLIFTSSNMQNGVRIFPDFKKLGAELQADIDFRFGLDNTWNAGLDLLVVNEILTPQQIEAYEDWKTHIGLKRARRVTKNSVIIPKKTKSN